MAPRSRAADTRISSQEDFYYTPPSETDIPKNLASKFEGEGYHVRWIRISNDGIPDEKNIGRRKAEGYEFVTMQETEGLLSMAVEQAIGRHGNIVCVGDLALGKIPLNRAYARVKHYETITRNQNLAARKEANKGLENKPFWDSNLAVYDESTTSVQVGRFADNN